jgi:hypothetical protein
VKEGYKGSKVVCMSQLCAYKDKGSLDVSLIPGRVGVPRSALSGYQSFEAFDPAEWVLHDYAAVNVDARGTFGQWLWYC